jgi:hypothetical protein
MTTAEQRKAARETLDGLPPDKLKVAVEFLRYLQERASEEATEELLRIPGLLEDLAEARKEIAAGKGTSVKKLRRKYKTHV